MNTAVQKITSVDFEISSWGAFKCFLFQANRPNILAKNLSEEEWNNLRDHFDDLAQQTKGNDSVFLLFVIALAAFFIRNHLSQ